MKIVIAGAGIGGLAAALALARTGQKVDVVERAPALTEIGAGVQITPNAAKVLQALGVGERLNAMATSPNLLELRLGRSGQRIFAIPVGSAAIERYGAPYLHIHRADLLGILREAAVQAGVQLRLGQALRSYAKEGDQVRAELVGGREIRADLMVGADGMQSAVRRQMLGDEAPRFTGSTAWRLIAPASAAPNLPRNAVVWVGPGRHAVTYWLRDFALINFVGVIEEGRPGGAAPRESWDEPGERADLKHAFAGWADPLPAIIEAGGACHRWPLFDRNPLPRWVDGRACLLGDACHPIPPFQAQGAAMAIEDAYVLARCLSEEGSDVDAALKRYQALRMPRTRRMLASARANMRIFHRSNRLVQLATYGPMVLANWLAPALVRSQQDWIYGCDVAKGAAVVG